MPSRFPSRGDLWHQAKRIYLVVLKGPADSLRKVTYESKLRAFRTSRKMHKLNPSVHLKGTSSGPS